MDYELKGRTCLVTGASAGIGAGITRLLADQGAKVIAVARRVDRIERLAFEILHHVQRFFERQAFAV